ncbi:MAG TPA: glycosyltransferase family 39 protein [Ktedonobacterales bacterium]
MSATDASAPAQTPQAWRRFAPAASIIGLIAVAAVLRFIGITHQSLWLDEAYSAYLAAHRFPQILAFTASSDAHPPLYYLVLHVWMLVGRSALALRALSAGASLGAVVMTYALGRRLASARVALLAATLIALSAFQVWYAQEARMYALTTLAVLIAMWAFVRACETQRTLFWSLFTCGMLAAIYLDYTAFFVYTALLVWFLRTGWNRVEIRQPFALSGAAILLGYLPWLPSLWRQMFIFGSLTSWVGSANGSGLTGALTDLFFNRSHLLLPDGGALATLATMGSVAVAAVALWAPRRAPAYPLLAYWFGWPCALELVAEILNHPLVIARTLMVTQPALFLLLALAAEVLWNPGPGAHTLMLRRILLVIALGVFVATNVGAQVASWNTTLKEDWRGAAAIVAAQERPGDLVLFNAYFTQMPFDYYFAASQRAHPDVVERGYQAEESLLFANLAPAKQGMVSGPELSSYARVWVVLSHAGAPDDQAVPPWLAAHDQLVRSWRFVGVTVRLYQVPDEPRGGEAAGSGSHMT